MLTLSYFLGNPNDVKITGVKRKIKHGVTVQGELTTTDIDDFQVRLTPGGEIEMVDDQGKTLSKKRQLQVLHDFDMRRKKKYRLEDTKLLASEVADDDDNEDTERTVPKNLGKEKMEVDDASDEEEAPPKAKVVFDCIIYYSIS